MRAVWIILGLVVLAGAIAVWNPVADDDSDARAVREARALVEDVGPTRAGGRAAGPGEASAAGKSTPEDSPQAGAAAAAAPPGAPLEAVSGAQELAAGIAAELAHAAASRAARSDAGALGATSGASGIPKGVLPSEPIGEPLLWGLDGKIPSATVVPGSIHELADGSIGADDRFVIRGSGTPEDPFRITWDLLVSASETYQPRQGKKSVPQRVAMLNGKHVRIEGYAAFPAFSFDPTDMLMMLNRWDGCCIGVPPTPFDAIEVKLAVVPKENRRQVAYFGSVEGKLAVEPYLADSWLVGMYVMTDARFRMDL